MHRVLAPGGRLLILEFGQPKIPIFRNLFKFYSQSLLPKIGGLLTGGQEKAYEYLNQSSEKFPCRGDFIKVIQQSAHFKTVELEELSGGIAFLYKATKG